MLDINVKDVSLVLEGGTFRTVFTMGILDAFLDEGIMMPHISGVSAGITYAGSYISQQKGRNIQILKKYRHDKRYMGVRNFLTDRSIFGLKFAFVRYDARGEIDSSFFPFRRRVKFSFFAISPFMISFT